MDWLEFASQKLDSSDLWFGHGTDNSWDEAVQIAMHVLNLPTNVSKEVASQILTEANLTKLDAILHERLNLKKPLPYITNKAYYGDHVYYVDERVLIPRSPIIELIHNKFYPWVKDVNSILDLCTGSGCMAIEAAFAFPEAKVVGSDISKDALTVANINKQQHGISDNLEFVEANLFDGLKPNKFDVIISNPPYVPFGRKETLPKEYHHEPDLALYTEEEGFYLVDKILTTAKNWLTNDGILIVEVGEIWEEFHEKYAHLPLIWLDFERGGEGVFLIFAKDL